MKPYTVEQLWKRYQRDPSLRWRNLLIEQYLPIVQFHAGKIHATLPNEVEVDDLVSVGIFGLITAIETYDISRGVKFETYCVLRIRGAMLDELRNLDWVPRQVRTIAKYLKERRKSIEDKLGRPCTDQELAKHLKLSWTAYKKLMRKAKIITVNSLDQKLQKYDDRRDIHLTDLLADKKSHSAVETLNDAECLKRYIRGMSRTEQLIITLYYYQGLSMREIGAVVGISESRISQLHKSILRRLKARFRSRQHMANAGLL